MPRLASQYRCRAGASRSRVAGCQTTPIAPPVLELPAPTLSQRSAARALVDAVRRSRARPARRRGARQQPRSPARDGAHRAGARQRAARARRPVSERQPRGRRVAQPHHRGRLAAAAVRLRSDLVELSASASPRRYELDLWGKYRDVHAAAQKQLLATQYARETVRTTIVAEVARAYFSLLAADAELALLRDTLKLRSESVALQRDRFEGGVIGELDLRQAEAERAAVVAEHRDRRTRDRASRIRARSARRPLAARRVHAGRAARRAIASDCSPFRRSRPDCLRVCSSVGPTCAAWKPSSPPRTCASTSRARTTSRRSR